MFNKLSDYPLFKEYPAPWRKQASKQASKQAVEVFQRLRTMALSIVMECGYSLPKNCAIQSLNCVYSMCLKRRVKAFTKFCGLTNW
jgi:hypothetical protein